MGTILRPFANLLNPGPYQVPTGKLTIDWLHPLARGLIGCWVPGAMGAVDLTGMAPTLTMLPGNKSGMTSDGPGISTVASTIAVSGLCGVATPPFKSWTEFSIYWRGYFISCEAFAYIAGVDYANPHGPPYIIADIQDNNDGNFVLNWNSNGSLGTGTPWAKSAGFKSLGATFKVSPSGLCTPYQSGSVIATPAAFGTIGPTSSATSRIGISGMDSIPRSSTATCNIACFWNRELSAYEMAWIDREPYSFLLPAEYEMPMLYLGPSFIPAWAQQSNISVIGAGTY